MKRLPLAGAITLLTLLLGGCRTPGLDERRDGGPFDLTAAAPRSSCGDQLCPVGQLCLPSCFGVPPETTPCVTMAADGPCPLGTVRGECRGGGGVVVRGCRQFGRCVEVRPGCDLARPTCGCFLADPCGQGCKDTAMGYQCPPCS